MFFINAKREQIKNDNPGIKVTEVAKKGGEMWRELSSEDKLEYENMAKKDKDRYTDEMKAYVAAGGGKDGETEKEGGKKRKKESTKSAAPSSMTGGSYKSKEYISDDSDDSDSDKGSSKKVLIIINTKS